MSSSPATNTYPPPPQRRTNPSSRQQNDLTLYSASPHSSLDAKHKKARTYTDPTWVTFSVLLIALVYWLVPGIPKSWTPRRSNLKDASHCPTITSGCNSAPPASEKMPWQTTFTLGGRGKGCHLVTDEVMRHINEGIKGTKVGVLHLFVQHTSAGLTLNENFDKDVRKDMDMVFDSVVPTSLPYRHTDEGPDDSASHSKATLCGSSVSVPITDGKLNLGTWQGLYLCEFRAEKHTRRVVATVIP